MLGNSALILSKKPGILFVGFSSKSSISNNITISSFLLTDQKFGPFIALISRIFINDLIVGWDMNNN
jgi:hypothetical protein